MVLIIGVLGAAIILLAFFMNQISKWKSNYLIYDLANVIGSALLITYSLIIQSWPFLILNLVWLIISIKESFSKDEKNVFLGHKKR